MLRYIILKIILSRFFIYDFLFYMIFICSVFKFYEIYLVCMWCVNSRINFVISLFDVMILFIVFFILRLIFLIKVLIIICVLEMCKIFYNIIYLCIFRFMKEGFYGLFF